MPDVQALGIGGGAGPGRQADAVEAGCDGEPSRALPCPVCLIGGRYGEERQVVVGSLGLLLASRPIEGDEAFSMWIQRAR